MKLTVLLNRIITATLVMVLAGLGLTHFVPGFDLLFVRSDSMHSTFRAGDAIVIFPSCFLNRGLEKGAIVAYRDGKEMITHRIVAVDGADLVTQGDSNNIADAPVETSQVIGVYSFRIPYLGYAIVFLSSKTGLLSVVVTPAMLLAAWFIFDLFKEGLRAGKESEERTPEPDYRLLDDNYRVLRRRLLRFFWSPPPKPKAVPVNPRLARMPAVQQQSTRHAKRRPVFAAKSVI